MKLKIEPVRELKYNENNCWGLYACDVVEGEDLVELNQYGNITISGAMPRLEVLKQYDIEVKETTHKRWGKQYEFVSMKIEKPSTEIEQKRFLDTLLTSHQVKSICSIYKFPVDEILKGTFDYKKVKGIGKVKYKVIEKKITENFVFFELLSELGQYGVTFNQIKQIYDKYKNPQVALQKIKDNPYILYHEIRGIGFKRADTIALKMNMSPIDDKRAIACIQYIIEQNEQEGHTFMFLSSLYLKLLELISDLTKTKSEISKLINESDYFTIIDTDKISLKHTYNTECKIKDELTRISLNPDQTFFNIEGFIEEQEIEQGFKYNQMQRKPFYDILNNNIVVITGYAGTGKSTVLNGLCNMFDKLDWDIWQFALSGKAADVMREYTGRDASTIHKGLGWSSEGYHYNSNNRMSYKVYIIDECSMVNIFLFKDLLEALPEDCKLIIVGDIGQLQSIGAGAILQDIIDSKKFPVTQLTEVYRQALESGILDLSTKIRNGKCFLDDNADGCFTFGNKKDVKILCNNKQHTINNIIKVYNHLLKTYRPEDIVVLLPRKDIQCGTKNLNKLLQDIVNPLNNKKTTGKFREDDIVINVVNNYDAVILEDDDSCEVFNGEIGTVSKIYEDNLHVKFNNKTVVYFYDILNNLELAYALTIHKSQGSQFKVVILGLDSNHWYQATRNLLYTGFTRASELLVVCCDPKIVNYAIANNPIKNKQTFLKDLLLNEVQMNG